MRPKIASIGLSLLLTLGMLFSAPGLADVFLHPNADGPAEFLDEAGVAIVGGWSSLPDGVGVEPSSHPYAVSRQEYQDLYNQANAWLQEAESYREEKLQHVQQGEMTSLDDVLQNYMDVNSGKLYKQFCADYDAVDAQGYCPPGDASLPTPKDLRNKLVWARDAFAALSVADPASMLITTTERVRDVGREGALHAARELALAHIVFGNEFLVDAMDTRFSGSDTVLQANSMLEEEILQLDLARKHFALAMDVMVDAFVQDIGGAYGARIGDYFGPQEFELYALASERMAFTLSELAFRYRQFGDGWITFADGRQERIHGDQSALELYTAAFSHQYIQAMGLAQEAMDNNVDFYDHGGWTILDSIARVHDGARMIQEGLNPFGYRDDYVPRETFTNLMNTARSAQQEAAELETEAQAANREFDRDASAVRSAKLALMDKYEAQLVDLCGGSGETPADFSPCDGGLIEQNYYDMVAASRRIALAWQRAYDIVERIKIEQEKNSATINVIMQGGQQLSAIALAEGKLRAFRTTSTIVDMTKDTSAWGFNQDVKGYFEAWVGGSRSINISLSPGASVEVGGMKMGLEMAASCVGNYRHEQSHTHAIETSMDLNELGIGHYESLRALSTAESQALIAGIASTATIKNLLLDQTERLMEWQIAIEEYNKLSAEHNHLVEKYFDLINRWQEADRVTTENYASTPGYRFLREEITIAAARSQSRAARYAYLAAKALEYDYLTPVGFIGDIYRARTAGDVATFLDDLEDLYNSWKDVESYHQKLYYISLAKDVAGLTDEALDPSGTLIPAELANLRYQKFQEFLQNHIVMETIRYAGQDMQRPFLSVSFETSLNTQLANGGFDSSTDWNIRIEGLNEPENACSSADPCEGMSVNIITKQAWDAPSGPGVSLRHGGANTLQKASGDLVEYDPGPLVLYADYDTPPSGEIWFRDKSVAASVTAAVNGEKGGYSPQLFNLSVAASTWQLRIDLQSNPSLDVSKIEDIVIALDTSAHARPLMKQPTKPQPAPLMPRLNIQPVEAVSMPSPAAPPDVSDVTAEICCTILIPPPAACGNAGIWNKTSQLRSLASQGLRGGSLLRSLLPASALEDAAVISDTFNGTVAITEPVRLGVADIAFDLVDHGGQLSGTLITTGTLAFDSSGTRVPLTGTVSGNLFTLTSAPIESVVSERVVQRRFVIVGQVLEDGTRLEGIYTEEIMGFMPDPIRVAGMFAASGKEPHQERLVETPAALRLTAAANSVQLSDSTVVSATLYNGVSRPLTTPQLITFTASSGTISPQVVETVNGVAVATFTAGITAEQAVITATSPHGWFVDTVQVTVGSPYRVYMPLILKNQ